MRSRHSCAAISFPNDSVPGMVPRIVGIGGGSPAVHQTGEPTMRKYKRQIEQAKQKAEHKTLLALEAQLPMSELIAGVREDIEGFAAELGLTIMQRVMAAEIDQKVGPWGRQQTHRHGHQRGYVIYAGRKV